MRRSYYAGLARPIKCRWKPLSLPHMNGRITFWLFWAFGYTDY